MLRLIQHHVLCSLAKTLIASRNSCASRPTGWEMLMELHACMNEW